MRRVRTVVTVLVVAAALLAACSSPTGSASPEAPAPGGPAGPGASGTATDPGVTSGDLITAAYEAGTLDRATALLHRLQAAVGDDRLPSEYRGAGAEEDGASALVLAEWETFSDAQRAAFLPYVVRPTDARSVWAPSAAAQGGVTLAVAHLASTCEGGFLREQVPAIPVVVWGQCGGASDSATLAKVEEVIAYLSELWGPMVDLMGEPIGDANDPGDAYPDPPEGADGLLDIYVVQTSISAHGRKLSNAALASTFATAPLVGPMAVAATSSYIVVDGTEPGGPAFKSTVAHEFFHSLQYAHNNLGTLYGAGGGWSRHWFTEASATWSEHRFVPEARGSEVYPRFSNGFQTTDRSLWSVAGDNEYDSWVWPYFMAQERGPDAIGNAWYDFEGLNGFDAIQEALGRQVSFTERFRDFAVRAWNIALNPGNAIDPMFQADDAAFPDDAPSGLNRRSDVAVPAGDPVTRGASLPSLWAFYYDVIPDAEVRTLEFDFSGLTPADALDVDLLINTAEGWQRRDGDVGRICDATEVIVVLANHDPTESRIVDGTWKATGSTEPCADGNWSISLTGAKAGAGSYSGTAEVIYCSIDETGAWDVLFQTDFTGDIYRASAGTNPQTISVNTRFAMDDPGDWDWQDSPIFRAGSVTITGDDSREPWTAKVSASWDDSHGFGDPIPLSVTIDVTCNDMYRAP